MIHLAYSAIKKRLIEKVNPKYVDFYYGQYLEEDMDETAPILWQTPAHFIEFAPIRWKTLGGNIQSSAIEFNHHLVNESYYDDDKRVLDSALGHLTQESQVFQALMNWRCMLSYVPGYEGLTDTADDRVLLESIVRTASEPDHTLRRQLVAVQQFTCTIYDYSATKQWTSILATLQLDVQKVDSL